MATIQPVQKVSQTAAAPSFVAADATGHSIASNNGSVLLYFRNANAGARNITIAPTQNVRAGNDQFPQVTIPNKVINVPPGEDRVFGPIPACYNDINGRVPMTFDLTTDLTVAALQLDPL